MSGWAAAFTGAGVTMFIGLVIMCCIERDLRLAVAESLAALVVGPFVVIAYVVRAGHWPRARKLSGRALARFANMRTTGRQSAWLLSYRGTGVILVTRRSGEGWVNNIANRGMNASRYGEGE